MVGCWLLSSKEITNNISFFPLLRFFKVIISRVEPTEVIRMESVVKNLMWAYCKFHYKLKGKESLPVLLTVFVISEIVSLIVHGNCKIYLRSMNLSAFLGLYPKINGKHLCAYCGICCILVTNEFWSPDMLLKLCLCY